MLRVFIDNQVFSWQLIGGVSRYFAEIIRNTPIEENIQYKYNFIGTRNYYLNNYEIFKYSTNPIIRKIQKSQRFNQIIKPILDYQPFDIYHPSYYNPRLFKSHKTKPIIVTFHDMTQEKYPEMFRNDVTINHKKICADEATHLIAVSQQTKDELVQYLNVPPNKITVIYHGIDLIDTTNIMKIIDFPYILYVGGRTLYKNFYRFINVFAEIHNKLPELNLVCTGNNFTEDEKRLIEKLNLSNCTHTILANETELISLYKFAECFVYPSENEGFGMPILESFRSGCPCVVSDIPCFHEVAGTSAEYFNPLNEEDMYSKIINLLSNTSRKEIMKTNGIKRCQLFTWKSSALKHINLYKSTI